jgi:rod shape-determining protein MreD
MNTSAFRDRNIYLMILGLGLVVLIQASLLARVRIFGAQPDLLLVTVVCWSLIAGITQGLVVAFVGGILLDLVSGLPVGASSLALMPVCFLSSLGRSSVYHNNLWLPVLLVALATPLHAWIILLTRQLRGAPIDWLGTTTHVILPEIALNIALTIIVMRVLWRLNRGLRLAPAAG